MARSDRALLRIPSALPASARAALWMIASGACWVTMAVAIRFADDTIHAFELVFFRAVFGALVFAPFLLRNGAARLRTRRWGLHGLRTAAALGGMMTWFWAITLMPMADVTALGYASPLFVTAGAALFLGERVGPRRWAAVAVGLAGAMVILRPGASAVTAVALVALLSAGFNALGNLTVKALSRTDTPEAIVFYMTILVIPMSFVPASFVWTWPGPREVGWLLLLGAAATAGHFAVARAFSAADASAVMPFDFFKLLIAALAGFLLYGESPVVWTWLGAAIIFSATLYSAHREARAVRARAPQQASGAPDAALLP